MKTNVWLVFMLYTKQTFYTTLFLVICKEGSFEIRKYKRKRLKNNFKTINISVNDVDKFEKIELKKRGLF